MITLPKTSFLPTIPAMRSAKVAQLKWHKNTQENHPRVRRKKATMHLDQPFRPFFWRAYKHTSYLFFAILLQNNNATTELPTKKEAQTTGSVFNSPISKWVPNTSSPK